MSNKAVPMVLIVLVLCVIGNASGDLVAHWKMDEGSGNIVVDSSGNEHDGTINGTPDWVAGQSGLALNFDGSTYVQVPASQSLDLLNHGDFTVTAWVTTDVVSDIYTVALQQPDASGTGRTWLGVSDGQFYHYLGGGNRWSGVYPELETWYHVAYVVTEGGNSDSMQWYVNGEPTASESASLETNDDGDYLIGCHKDLGNLWDGLIDDIRIFDHALTKAQILAVMEGTEGYPFAFGPEPADGVLIEDTWSNLSWSSGDFAVSHDVYIGDNFDDVDSGAEGTFQGNQIGTFIVVGFPGFPFPDGLVPGTTYYWRIDEVNDTEPNSPWKGKIWSFSVPPKTAYAPDPADGAEVVDVDVQLSWTGGFGSKLHTVYFGDNFDDVSNAAGGLPQGATTFTPSPLEWAKTYYWRVDEFDTITTHKGNVWSFTTERTESVLQFKSGFEPNTYILGDKIKGIDNSGPPGANSWDNLSDYLPWVLMGDGYFEGGSMEISADPFNSANHVLHLHTFQNDKGYARSQWSLEQMHNWYFEGKPNLFEQQFYRFRMLIPNRISTLYSYDEKSPWYMIWESHAWEFENTRHGIYILKAANSNEWHFEVVQRYPASLGTILYKNKIYQDIVVPMGEWFTFDIFFRYHETNGEFYASIKRDGQPKQTIADFKGQTKFGTKLHDQMMFKLYHDGDYINRTSALGIDGIHQYYDDFEIWSDYPGEKR